MNLTLVASPYEGDSAKLTQFLKDNDIQFHSKLVECDIFLMELVEFTFTNEEDHQLAENFLDTL